MGYNKDSYLNHIIFWSSPQTGQKSCLLSVNSTEWTRTGKQVLLADTLLHHIFSLAKYHQTLKHLQWDTDHITASRFTYYTVSMVLPVLPFLSNLKSSRSYELSFSPDLKSFSCVLVSWSRVWLWGLGALWFCVGFFSWTVFSILES